MLRAITQPTTTSLKWHPPPLIDGLLYYLGSDMPSHHNAYPVWAPIHHARPLLQRCLLISFELWNSMPGHLHVQITFLDRLQLQHLTEPSFHSDTLILLLRLIFNAELFSWADGSLHPTSNLTSCPWAPFHRNSFFNMHRLWNPTASHLHTRCPSLPARSPTARHTATTTGMYLYLPQVLAPQARWHSHALLALSGLPHAF